MKETLAEKQKRKRALGGALRKVCDKDSCPQVPLKWIKRELRERVEIMDFMIEFYAYCPHCKCRYGRQLKGSELTEVMGEGDLSEMGVKGGKGLAGN